MSSQAIEKLRRKFILVATLSFAGAMLLIAGLIYITNLLVTRREISNVIDYIVDNEGELPSPFTGRQLLPEETANGFSEDSSYENDTEDTLSEKKIMEISLADLFGYRNRIYASRESLYSIRYFAVLFDADGEVTDVKTSHIAAVEDDEAEEYARVALRQFFRFGSFGVFYYKVADLDNGGKIVVYMDSTNQVTTNVRLLIVALILIGLGIVIAFLLVRFFSFRVVRPEIEAANRQKLFITNASHELKTPLAVIKANTEVEQMINGENEWNTSTLKQVDRMTGLISNLVMIAKAEEKENNAPREMIDVSAVISETADSFLAMASSDGKKLEKNISEGITRMAAESDIRQLATLLLDNAVKYCDQGGTITIALDEGRGKSVRLAVSNTYAEGADTDTTRFFDRFYRKDESHNVDRGGYGIGLSIAESLLTGYNGTLDASWKDGVITFTCVLKFSVPARRR